MTSAFGGQRSIQLSYGCPIGPTLDQTPQIKQRRGRKSHIRRDKAEINMCLPFPLLHPRDLTQCSIGVGMA